MPQYGRSVIGTLIACVFAVPAPMSAQASPCDRFAQLEKRTYDFHPAAMTDAQRDARSKEIDKFWTVVQSERATMLPCLRGALEQGADTSLFAFDGGELLLTMDSSSSAKALQVRASSRVGFEYVDLGTWVRLMTRRAYEGYDVSLAGFRWLELPDSQAHYRVGPEHAAAKMNQLAGAIFMFGSMPESIATPALVKFVHGPPSKARETALYLLTLQATTEAYAALRTIDTAGLSAQAMAGVKQFVASPPRFEKRLGKTKTTRDDYVRAFTAIVSKDDFAPFDALVEKVPDGEQDVVTVMTAADIPLIRQVRRRYARKGNQHVFDDYDSFTKILWTMVLPGN